MFSQVTMLHTDTHTHTFCDRAVLWECSNKSALQSAGLSSISRSRVTRSLLPAGRLQTCMLLCFPSFSHTEIDPLSPRSPIWWFNIITVILLSFCLLDSSWCKSQSSWAESAWVAMIVPLFCENSEIFSTLLLTVWWRTFGDWGLARKR